MIDWLCRLLARLPTKREGGAIGRAEDIDERLAELHKEEMPENPDTDIDLVQFHKIHLETVREDDE